MRARAPKLARSCGQMPPKGCSCSASSSAQRSCGMRRLSGTCSSRNMYISSLETGLSPALCAESMYICTQSICGGRENTARQQPCPVKRGLDECGNRTDRTCECNPSAPTTRSYSSCSPSVQCTSTRDPVSRKDASLTPSRTRTPRARVSPARISCRTGRRIPPPLGIPVGSGGVSARWSSRPLTSRSSNAECTCPAALTRSRTPILSSARRLAPLSEMPAPTGLHARSSSIRSTVNCARRKQMPSAMPLGPPPIIRTLRNDLRTPRFNSHDSVILSYCARGKIS
jgi:hypothetical protein